MPKHQFASRDLSSNKQLYYHDIKRVRLVNNCRAMSALVANQQDLLQAPASFPIASLSATTFFEARLIDVLAQ